MNNAVVLWSDDLLVHIEAIDNDHKELFQLINRFLELRGRTKDEVLQSINALWNYTKHHFSKEETLMEAVGYDQLTRHRTEHKDLVLHLEYLIDRVMQSGAEAIDDTLIQFMKSWLQDHIIGFDHKFAMFHKNLS